MNRGHGGERVFATKGLKESYLQFLREAANHYHIPVIAYCLMDNHFHLVVENGGGCLSRFMRAVHTRYGFKYRREVGGKGYVFQDRFKSTLIQNDPYLLQAVCYVLNNPVRAGLVPDALGYPWSSVGAYYSNGGEQWIERERVEGLFPGKQGFLEALRTSVGTSLPERKSRHGLVLGDEGFIELAERRYNRRENVDFPKNFREVDQFFHPVEQVLRGYEQRIGKSVERTDVGCYEGKRQRADLLVLLKDLAGLTYREIMEFDVFRGLSFASLGRVYGNARKRHARER